MSRIALDWDGTLQTRAWPGWGEWYPGAIETVQTLHEAGHSLFVYSSRVGPTWPDGSRMDPLMVMQAVDGIRTRLDEAGLRYVDIFTGEGKPHWDVLVDDKAMYFPGRARSWRAMLPKILIRVHDEDSYAEVMEHA